MQRGFTFIDVIVGTALVLIVFSGIFAAYQLGLKIIDQSKNKITATAIGNQQLEVIRNLPYTLIGTKEAALPYAQGILETATTTIRNNIEYTVNIQVKYIVDETDGLAFPEDDCYLDYKRVEVKISWSGRFSGEVKLATDIAPKDKIEEISACTSQPGGILSVSIFNAYGEMVNFPSIEIFNSATGQKVISYSPATGEYDFPLATATYKVAVSEEGYSREETFDSGESYKGKTIITSAKPNPIVLEGKVSEISFSIDRVSAFSIDTLSPWGSDNFADTFSNESKISEKSNVAVSGGEGRLATTTPEEYYSAGYLVSFPVAPADLLQWDKFSFSDEEPENTDLRYQVLYATGTDWALVPDSILPGNFAGFDDSPIDLANLAIATYFQLKLKADFMTNIVTSTPLLYDWQVSWITSQPIPITNVVFNLRGDKIVGLDNSENPIYKYSQNLTSESNGHLNLANLEWDNYTFSVAPAIGLDLIGTDPSSQPIGLAPNNTLEVDLFLEAGNSLLLTIQNMTTLEPVFSANIRLSNSGLGYDTSQYTNEKGQTIFIPLTIATYNLAIEAPGYLSTSTTVWLSGDTTKTIRIEQIE